MFLVFHNWNVYVCIQIWMFLVFSYWNIYVHIQIWMFLVFRYWNNVHIQIWMFLVIRNWDNYVCLHSNLDVSCLPKLECNFDITFVCS